MTENQAREYAARLAKMDAEGLNAEIRSAIISFDISRSNYNRRACELVYAECERRGVVQDYAVALKNVWNSAL